VLDVLSGGILVPVGRLAGGLGRALGLRAWRLDAGCIGRGREALHLRRAATARVGLVRPRLRLDGLGGVTRVELCELPCAVAAFATSGAPRWPAPNISIGIRNAAPTSSTTSVVRLQ
jgi:hypothetical protein